MSCSGADNEEDSYATFCTHVENQEFNKVREIIQDFWNETSNDRKEALIDFLQEFPCVRQVEYHGMLKMNPPTMVFTIVFISNGVTVEKSLGIQSGRVKLS